MPATAACPELGPVPSGSDPLARPVTGRCAGDGRMGWGLPIPPLLILLGLGGGSPRRALRPQPLAGAR